MISKIVQNEFGQPPKVTFKEKTSHLLIFLKKYCDVSINDTIYNPNRVQIKTIRVSESVNNTVVQKCQIEKIFVA